MGGGGGTRHNSNLLLGGEEGGRSLNTPIHTPVTLECPHLLIEESQGDNDLEGKTPELVEAVAEVHNPITIRAHKVHHLKYKYARYAFGSCIYVAQKEIPLPSVTLSSSDLLPISAVPLITYLSHILFLCKI